MTNPTQRDAPDPAGDRAETRDLSELIDNDLAALRRAGSTESVASGATLFSQGERVKGIACLIEGTVAIHRSHGKEHSTLLRLLDSGSTLGLDGVFGSGIHSNSAVTLTECSVCWIAPEALCDLMAKSPAVIRKVLGRLAFDLQASDEARVNVVHLQVRARLAALLLALRDRHGTVDDFGNLVIRLPLSRRDMASAIGTRPESLSRAIRALENDRVASFHGKRVVVQDLDDLLDEVEQ